MFQGDENDFIIVSLVRCNPQGAIGFLAEESRRCVAQSRARCGLYLIGSASTLIKKSGSSWIPFLNLMRSEGCVSDTFQLQCYRHKEKSVVHIPDADALERLFKEPKKVCKLICGVMFDCGLHPCARLCFPSHTHASCMTMVSFTHPACGHDDKKRCYEKISDIKCKTSVLLEFTSCDHKAEVSCSRKQEHQTGIKAKAVKCIAQVVARFPSCGHNITKKCHMQLADLICKSVVLDKGGCGHEMTRECHIPLSQVQCQFRPCAKLRHCGHPCVNVCGQACDQGDCSSCRAEQEHRMKKNQHRARINVKRLRQEIEEAGTTFSKKELEQESPEYMTVYDQVTKYILPMHNWYPHVTKIEKVYNLELEAKYEEYKTEAFGDHEDRKFHGTDDAGVEGITRQGFRIGSAGMYGAGIYFATDSSKSSQEIYTKGSNKLLLCKVFLGRAKTVTKADKGLTGKWLRKEGYDSVFAPRGTKSTGGVLNDEFVVFDPRQAVVQYVIHYSSSAAVLPSGRINQLTRANCGQPFTKVRMTPGRAVKLNDPMDATYRFAEGHFHRMMGARVGIGVGASHSTISGITVVVNAKLAEKFETTRKSFEKEKKGNIFIDGHVC